MHLSELKSFNDSRSWKIAESKTENYWLGFLFYQYITLISYILKILFRLIISCKSFTKRLVSSNFTKFMIFFQALFRGFCLLRSDTCWLHSQKLHPLVSRIINPLFQRTNQGIAVRLMCGRVYTNSKILVCIYFLMMMAYTLWSACQYTTSFVIPRIKCRGNCFCLNYFSIWNK